MKSFVAAVCNRRISAGIKNAALTEQRYNYD
jgi:hypothetical protein